MFQPDGLIRQRSGRYLGGTFQRPARLQYAVLGEIALAVIPAMLVVKAGAPRLGAYWLFLVVGACLVVNAFASGTVANMALVVGVMPAAALLRTLFLYNSVILLLAAALAGIVFRSRKQMRLLTGAGFVWILYFSILYWLVSYALTGDYSSNLRMLELVLGAAVLLALLRFPDFLATALFGLLLSLVVIGAALYGYGDRLGYASVDGISLGNPITFGEPLALLLLLLVADNGKWFLLQRNAPLRMLLCLIVGVLLLLSTSRGSWLVAAAGLVVILALNRRSRASVLVGLAVLGIALGVALRTDRGQDLSAWIGRTFSDDRSLSKRTDGRTDQWILVPAVMRDAQPWGFGPGTGPEIYARYSALDPRVRLDPGHGMAWHSLYLQFLVENGVIGLAALLILLAVLIRADLRHWRHTGEVMPLVATIGFMMIALTVSGMDAPSGFYLGFGFALRHNLPRARTRREAPAVADVFETRPEPELALP